MARNTNQTAIMPICLNIVLERNTKTTKLVISWNRDFKIPEYSLLLWRQRRFNTFHAVYSLCATAPRNFAKMRVWDLRFVSESFSIAYERNQSFVPVAVLKFNNPPSLMTQNNPCFSLSLYLVGRKWAQCQPTKLKIPMNLYQHCYR